MTQKLPQRLKAGTIHHLNAGLKACSTPNPAANAMNQPKSSLPLGKSLLVAMLLSIAAAYGQQYPNKGYKSAPARVPAPHDSLDATTVELGRRLFFETRLSADQKISCSSCHDPAHGFSDARALSIGVFGRRPKRHTPTIIGRGFRTREGEPFEFWDGRAATLEEQVLQPIADPDEMGMTIEDVLQRLNQDRAYVRVAGGPLIRKSLSQALAAYVRTLSSENSSVDRFLAGRPNGFTDLELEGFRLFQDKARCYLCHSGPQFTDENFHNTGIAWRDGGLQDEGRAAIDGKVYHKGAFKTPTLRDLARRGPYMHDGSLATLEEVVDYYDRGGNQNPHLDENILALHLSEAEKKALLAFLRTGLAGSVAEERREGQ
jgi:cytochrome c peroxidase